MLDLVDLRPQLEKSVYKARLPELQRRLHQLQQACWEAKIGHLVVFEGWSASGKGATIRKLTERLEPRGFDIHVTAEPRSAELQLPWLWRFWADLPRYGHVAIYDRAWPTRALRLRAESTGDDAQRAFAAVRSFERALTDDRYGIVKFFLHIDRDEQRRRLDELAADPHTAWRVTDEDWRRHEAWDERLEAAEEMLERTETEWAPWTLVAATDKRWARTRVFETLIERLEASLRRHGHEPPEPWVEVTDGYEVTS